MHAAVGLKRENHFLPVCYQKGFTDSAGRVWVKFAGQEKPLPRYPKQIGKQRGFYIRSRGGVEDDLFERFLGKEVENDFAKLSQQVKLEQDRISNLTGSQLGALGRFVAWQVVRGPANKRCMEEQMGRSLDTNEFLWEMSKQVKAIITLWAKDPPGFHFHTSLPFVDERFITGDNPVVLECPSSDVIRTPTEDARLEVGPIQEVVNGPGVSCTVGLSPYISVSLRSHGGGMTHLPPITQEPSEIKLFNKRIRGQCRLFTLARDKASLT